MRNMSFMLTTKQVRDRTKTVTRRVGWGFLKPGDLVQAVEKAQGLKKGEKVRPLGVVRVVAVYRERLDKITKGHCVREGFPELSQAEFVRHFCRSMRVKTDQVVNVIEFEYVD